MVDFAKENGIVETRMKAVLFIAIGAALGAISRWGLDGLHDDSSDFPIGIFVVNIVGCFLFGLLFGIGESKQLFSEAVRLGIFTGFLGSFTTFSTFGWNSFEYLKNGQIGLALINVGGSVIFGILAVWGGYVLSRQF